MDHQLADWNDSMYAKHPTPYKGLAGMVELKRVQMVSSLAAIQPGDAVLEIGCEAGNLLARLPEAKRLVGFDISKTALEDAAAKFKALGRKAEFVHGDAALKFPFSRGEFSAIICSEVLEHVKEPRLVLENIRRLATPETRIVLTVPNEKPKLVIKRMLRRMGLMRLIMPSIEENQSEWHLHQFSKKDLTAMLDGLFIINEIKTVLLLHIVASVSAGLNPTES